MSLKGKGNEEEKESTLEMMKLRVQVERHRLQRPKNLSEGRFEEMQEEEKVRNESDKMWTQYTAERRGELEDALARQGSEKIQIDIERSKRERNDTEGGDTTIVSQSNGIGDYEGEGMDSTKEITGPNNSKEVDGTGGEIKITEFGDKEGGKKSDVIEEEDGGFDEEF